MARQWTSYSGDYTGRRYSSLTQINQSNVQHLTLAWAASDCRSAGGPTWPRPPLPARPIVVGGEGSGDVVVAGATTIKGTVLAGQRRALRDGA